MDEKQIIGSWWPVKWVPRSPTTTLQPSHLLKPVGYRAHLSYSPQFNLFLRERESRNIMRMRTTGQGGVEENEVVIAAGKTLPR